MSDTKISDELLSCPFCGGEGKTCQNGGVVYIVCLDCHTQGPPKSTTHPQVVTEAVSSWNLRTSPPPSGEAGEVKSLEWADRAAYDEDGGYDVVGSAAKTSFSFDYWTSHADHDERLWRLYLGLTVVGRFDTEAEAKTAAQSDFATRIRSALLPAISEPTDESRNRP